LTRDLLVVVPARGGSKRLPHKNMRPLGGRSLLGWTMEAVVDAGLPVPVLTTDDPEIAEEGRRLGYRVPFMRPIELATDSVATVPVVVHALEEVRRLDSVDYRAALLLQPTSPFRGPQLLRSVADLFLSAGAPAVIATRTLHVSSGSLYRVDGDEIQAVLPGGRETVHVPTGAAYMVDARVLARDETFVPKGTLHVAHEGVSTIDIDTWADWAIAEAVIAKGLHLTSTQRGSEHVLR
jgi:CMP-N,N'-diacetyllegionaminic acid synthase